MDGRPFFIGYKAVEGKVIKEDSIEEATWILYPPSYEDSNFIPYEFKNETEIEELVEKAKRMEIFDIYQNVYETISQFIYQEEKNVKLMQ